MIVTLYKEVQVLYDGPFRVHVIATNALRTVDSYNDSDNRESKVTHIRPFLVRTYSNRSHYYLSYIKKSFARTNNNAIYSITIYGRACAANAGT